MTIDRRTMLGLLPLAATLPLLGFARGALAQATVPGIPAQADFQTQLAPFWNQLALLPNVRGPALDTPSAGICYMFTNKDCEVCQLVHKEYPHGYRHMEMRYIIYPWPGESYRELNYMYRPETTLAEYETYMAHKLSVQSPSDSSAQADLITAVAADMAHQLVEGDAFGTPFFFHAVPGTTPGSLLYSAGDIVAMATLLDSAA